MINFLFFTVLLPEASKFDQTHNFDDFLNRTQFFHIWPDSVMIEMKYVRNYVINIFKLNDQLSRIHSFHYKSFWIEQNSAISQEFVMMFKVVVNNIVDIIHFDQNTVWSNVKELCKILKIIKFMSLVNFGSSRRENSAK